MAGASRDSLLRRLAAAALCVLAPAVLLGTPAEAATGSFDGATADRALAFSRQQLRRTATSLAADPTRSPKSSTGGPWKLIANTDRVGWTQGFFPGALWLLYAPGGEAVWRERAEAWTWPLEVQKTNTETHDLGFKFMPSFGQAYRLTGDPRAREVLLTAADSLARRFNPRVGVIDCCDWNDPPWHVAMVTDTMVDLELLFWAARNGGNPAWNEMALSHALKTLEDMVRADGGTFHVVDYDNAGRVASRETFQGYADSSTWSRGQAWALYGFTLAYRYTRDPRMLEGARRTTDYYLAHLPADGVPPWDFDAPGNARVRDSSAAAITASALQELSTYVGEEDAALARRYREAALRMLDTLTSPPYLASGTSFPGILLHGVAFYRTPIKPQGDDIDANLIYGDYYFLEALERFRRDDSGGWYPGLTFPATRRDLGPGQTGVRIVEFDVTPLGAVVDAVIGYTGRGAPVTGYASLPIALRLNADGFFDVRRGTEYAALARVPYTAHATYHVRLRVDLAARTTSAWVTPPGGSPVLIAERFAFRPSAPAMTELGQVVLQSNRFADAYQVRRHTARAEGSEGVPPPDGGSEVDGGAPPADDAGTPAGVDPPEENTGRSVPPLEPGDARGGCGGAPGLLLGGLILLPLWSLRRRKDA